MKKPSLEQSYTLSQEPDGYVIINGVRYVKEEPKEETFVISREQWMEFYDKGIHHLFGSKTAFVEDKKELVVGKWYRKKDFGKLMFCFNGKYGQMSQYGFNFVGEWSEQLGIYEDEEYFELSQQEVEEALKAEAVRLKYKENLKHVECLCGFNKETSQEYYSDNKSIFYYEKHVNKLWVQDGSYLDICIFDSGKWAEIIQPKKMTKAEIEKELGHNIEIV